MKIVSETTCSFALIHPWISAPLPVVEKKITGLQKGGRLIVEQNDPNSPLYSVKSFEELSL
jgi:hypothetical protein